MPRAKDALGLGARPGRACGGAALELHASPRHGDLVGGEVEDARAVRCVGEQGEAGEGNRQGDDAIDHEQPLPRLEASGAAGTDACVHGGHEVARRHLADEAGRLVHGRALAQLVVAVPRPEKVQDSRVAAAFEQTDEKAEGIKVGRGVSFGE